jgi:hypothetical protein
MTATYHVSAALQGEETLAPTLRAAHEVWIREASSYLVPISAPDAGFWERWTAVRYLADQFLAQFHRERALIDELRLLLPPEVVDHLDREAQRIAERREQLDRIGRRRGTGHTVGMAARALLHALRIWCVELEATVGRLRRESLPDQASQLIADLEVYTQVHR